MSDGVADQLLEGARVEGVVLVDVDGPPGAAAEAGVEQPGGVVERRALGEGELDLVLVDLAGADDPVVGPRRDVVEEGVAEFDKDADSYVPMEELKASGDPRWHEIVGGGYFGDTSPDEFQSTVVRTVERIIADNPGGRVAIVCHGGVINAYLAHVLDLDDLLFFEPAYTSISRVVASRRGHRMLLSANETAHLRDLRTPLHPQG